MPALEPDMRSNCARCGTVLRLTRADPLNRHLALTFAALVLFAVLWLAMLMKVSTAGIVHETTLESGPIELVNRGLWPLALAVAFTTALAPVGKFAGTLYVLIGLKMRRLPPNLRGVFLVARRHRHLGDAGGAAAGRVRGLHQARRPGHASSSARPSMRSACSPSSWCGPKLALDPHAVWEEIERRGQTHAPMPDRAPLDFRPGAAGCEGCGLVCVPAESRRPVPALRRCGCTSASPTASRAPGPS